MRPAIIALLALALVLPPSLAGTDPGEPAVYPAGLEAELSPWDVDEPHGEVFGFSVAVQGNLTAIGAIGDDEGAEASGAVYLFERTKVGWQPVVKLKSPNPGRIESLGARLDLDEDTLVAGTFDPEAHVFARDAADGWHHDEVLIPPGVDPNSTLSGDTAVSGNTIAFGVNGGDRGPAGAVHVFELTPDGWVETQEIPPPKHMDRQRFGDALALDGTTMVVGARNSDATGQDSGAAFIYERSQAGLWELVNRLEPADLAAGDEFGSSADIEGDTVLVGASKSNRGSAYVFERNETRAWIEKAKLIPGPRQHGSTMTESKISGDTIALAMSSEEIDHRRTGAVHLFQRDGASWSFVEKLVQLDLAENFFAHGMGIDGNMVVVGAFNEDGESSQIAETVRNEPCQCTPTPPLWLRRDLGDRTYIGGAFVFTPDLDQDGISTWAEDHTHPTKPDTPDTDGDGLLDGDEIWLHRTDPLVVDTDHDGLTDLEEVTIYSTDPLDPDTDGDLFSDGTEVHGNEIVTGGSQPANAASVPTPIGPVTLIEGRGTFPGTDELDPVM